MGTENLPVPGLYVTDGLASLFTSSMKQLYADAGRTITLYLPPSASGCPNCLVGPDGSSQGVYNSSNPFTLNGAFNKPFPNGGFCPICKGTNKIFTSITAQYTALIQRNPKELRYRAIGKDFDPQNIYLTKTVIAAYEDIKIATKALIDGNMCVRIIDPIKTGLRDLEFVRCLWKRMDK